MALEGYQDIDKYVGNKGQMLDQQLQTMNDLTDKDVQLQTERLARQKEDIDRETVQQNRAIYQDYRKNSNPFGVQAENLASQGLGNSGYAETTQSRLYNTYQNNITSTLNTARQLKADVDFAINEAIKTGDITKGQNAIRVFEQRMQLLSEEFDLKNNREQVLYQRERDKIEDNWRNKEWNYKVKQEKKQWDYQVKQDKNEEKWRQKEWDYNTSKKSSATSSRRSSSSGSKKKYNDDLAVYTGDEPKNKTTTNTTKQQNTDKRGWLTKMTDTALDKTRANAYETLRKRVANGEITEKEAEKIFNSLGL